MERTAYVVSIDEEFEKSRVKAHVRTRRGKIERVREFERAGAKHPDPKNAREVFENMFPITKDLQPLRRKGGPYLEDIAAEVQSKFGVDTSVKTPVSEHDGVFTNKDGSIGIYYFSMRMGMPTYAVGVKDPAKWKEIRDHLISKNLVRS
jgi:hypothetical protein